MGILFPGFWTIRLDRIWIAYSLIPDPNDTAKVHLILKRWQVPQIKAHFRILWSWLLCPREEPDP